MPYVMSSQGDKLNRFTRESLDSFNMEQEWEDYRALVEKPIEGVIKLHEPALRKLFDLTNGHPFFTKTLCAKIYELACNAQDAEVSNAEVEKAAEKVVDTLDINSFAHYWRDGILGADDIEIVSSKRRRLLVAWARTARLRKPLTCVSIQENLHTDGLTAAEVRPLLEDLCRRGVFREEEGNYFPVVDLFGVWLREGGFSKLADDYQLADALAQARQQNEDAAYVQREEIRELLDSWSLYQGREITPERIREWLEQAKSNVEQRLLFKLLQNVRFFSDIEIQEKFKEAYRQIPKPVWSVTSRIRQRDDIFVSYFGGEGNSGVHYAQMFARNNPIMMKNVVTIDAFFNRLKTQGRDEKISLVIVDDMIGTGGTLEAQLTEHSELFQQKGIGTEAIGLSVVVLCATLDGERRVRDCLTNLEMENAYSPFAQTWRQIRDYVKLRV